MIYALPAPAVSSYKMPQCSVPGCTTQGGHKFPIGVEKCKEWVVAIQREEVGKRGKLWVPCKNARVCHGHFDASDYKDVNYYG